MFKLRLLASVAVAVAAATLALPMAVAAAETVIRWAASLTDAFKELGPRFEAARPGTSLRFNFAASGALLQQIVQGAQVDVFASADQATMNRAAEQKLIDVDSRRNFVTNSLVLIEPAQGGTGVKSLQDLNGPAVKRIAIGKVATVPVGAYTKQVLDGARLWEPLEPKFVQADSVRQVLDYVGRGEVDAGFVYSTDAIVAGDKVKVVATPNGHTPVSYPVAVTADSRQKALARDFTGYLAGEEAQAVFKRYGFGKP
jgi:molybdate transport system substrate-binding protein